MVIFLTFLKQKNIKYRYLYTVQYILTKQNKIRYKRVIIDSNVNNLSVNGKENNVKEKNM